jgi:hypothetical protein
MAPDKTLEGGKEGEPDAPAERSITDGAADVLEAFMSVARRALARGRDETLVVELTSSPPDSEAEAASSSELDEPVGRCIPPTPSITLSDDILDAVPADPPLDVAGEKVGLDADVDAICIPYTPPLTEFPEMLEGEPTLDVAPTEEVDAPLSVELAPLEVAPLYISLGRYERETPAIGTWKVLLGLATPSDWQTDKKLLYWPMDC